MTSAGRRSQRLTPRAAAARGNVLRLARRRAVLHLRLMFLILPTAF